MPASPTTASTLRRSLLPLAASAVLLLTACTTTGGDTQSTAGGSPRRRHPRLRHRRRRAGLPRPPRRRQLPAGADRRSTSNPSSRSTRTGRSSRGCQHHGRARDDGLSWEFTLQDDVTFTDGSPLDAAAVKANVAHIQNPRPVVDRLPRSRQGRPASRPSPTDVARFTLSAPDSALLESLTQPWLAIESPTGSSAARRELLRPRGHRPIRVTSGSSRTRHADGTRPTTRRPPTPRTAAGHLDSITWRFLPDSASRYAALQAGQST